MTTPIISFRLPIAVADAFRKSAANAHLSPGQALDWLLRYSVGNSELLRELVDCSGPRNSKVDARVAIQTLQQLNLASQKLGISISVYTRRLLYHYYMTKRVLFLKSGGHYTLAVRND